MSWDESRAIRPLKGVVQGLYCKLETWNVSWNFENNLIQISDSFISIPLNWSGQIDGHSQSMVKKKLTNYYE